MKHIFGTVLLFLNATSVLRGSDQAANSIPAFFSTQGTMSYNDPRLQSFLDELTRPHPDEPLGLEFHDVGGSEVEFLDTAERTSELWTTLIQNAQQHIHIQTYFFVDDVAYHDEEPVPCANSPEVLQSNYIACMLWQAADRGIHIRLIADSLGNTNIIVGGDRILYQLAEHPRIEVQYYNPVLAYNGLRDYLWEPYGIWLWPQNRLHSKVMIVDGREAIMGGRNIGRNYIKPAPDPRSPSWGPRVYGEASDYKYRDTDVYVKGPAVAEIQRGFLRNWLEFGDWERTLSDQSGSWSLLNPGSWINAADCLQKNFYGVQFYCKEKDPRLKAVHSPAELAWDPEFFPALPATGSSWVRLIESSPIRMGQIPDRPYLRLHPSADEDMIRFFDPQVDAYRGLTHGERVYLTLIHNARRSIRLTNSYFALSEPLRDALRQAIQRRVKVEVFTNSFQSNDEAILWDCSIEDFKIFLDLGADIYEWMSRYGMLHAKTAIFDDEIALVGSFNFDNASFKSNIEAITLIRGATALRDMNRVWSLDLQNPMTRKMTPATLEHDANSRGLVGYVAKPICQKLGGLSW